MRTALLVAGGLLAAFFAAACGATFFARDHVTRLAEDYVIHRTQEFADPLVELTENAMTAFQERAMGGDMRGMRAARQELAEYRRDPRAYVASLVAAGEPAGAGEPGPGAAPRDQVLFWKAEVRAHFQETLDRLLLDLRIFTGSNLVAALAVVGLAVAGRRERLPRFLPAAGLILASVAYMTYVYVDQFSYFNILLGTYMGWWYPALLGFTFVGAFAEQRRPGPKVNQSPEEDRSDQPPATGDGERVTSNE